METENSMAFSFNSNTIIEINEKIILKCTYGSGSTILSERYKYMVEELKIPSEKILVLVLNKDQLANWRNNIEFKSSGEIWTTTYYNFIQKEIVTYYPLLLKEIKKVQIKDIKPVFTSFDISRFLISKALEGRRSKNHAFSGVTALNGRIAGEIASNLLKAATSNVPMNEIGERLYNSLENKDNDKKQLFEDFDNIANAYSNKCYELGIFDLGMTVDIYNHILLKNDTYLTQLSGRVEHILVNNIEEYGLVQIDFLATMLDRIKSCILTYDQEGGFNENSLCSHQYISQMLNGKCKTVEINDDLIKSRNIHKFSELLFDNIKNSNSHKYGAIPEIERIAPCELRSEMLEKLGDRVIKLIDIEGYLPSDILILSTFADKVTELVIGSKLKNKGYKLNNQVGSSRLFDNETSRMLVALSVICHPDFRILPLKEDMSTLFRRYLELDPVRSSILAGEFIKQRQLPTSHELKLNFDSGFFEGLKIEKYEHLYIWVNDYLKSDSLPIDQYLKLAFLEIVITEDLSFSGISSTKDILDNAEDFLKVVNRFNFSNVNKSFIEMFKGELKTSDGNLSDNEDGNNFINFSTPQKFLLNPSNYKVIILTSISSNNWSPRIVRELSNSLVLNKTWDKDKIYTVEQEEENQRNYLANLMRAILKRCQEKVITFESELSANGYENNGRLVEYLDNI